jgi:hypothetical protein
VSRADAQPTKSNGEKRIPMTLTRAPRRLPRVLIGIAACVVMLAVMAPAVGAQEFGFAPNGFDVRALDADGDPETRAGVAPDRLITTLAPNRVADPYDGHPVMVDNLKNADVLLPPGLVGNARDIPKCPEFNFTFGFCPPESRVGTATLELNPYFVPPAPIVNLPPGKHVARFAFHAAPGFGVTYLVSDIVEEDGEYRVRTRVTGITAVLGLLSTEIELWGVPADHNGSGAQRVSLLTNPTSCHADMQAAARINSWQNPDTWVSAVGDTVTPVTECEAVPFEPSVHVAADSAETNAPTGLTVKLEVPQTEGLASRAASHLKDAVVTLPEGMTLSPSVADGLAGCSDTQLGDEGEPVDCPEASRIGSAVLKTPALADPVPGDIYVGAPSGTERYRLFVVLHLPGSTVRLQGAIDPDPTTGRLTTRFLDSPQLPFSELTLRFKGGSRAPLVTPGTCGTKGVQAALTPWSDPGSPVVATGSLAIDEGCAPAGFDPGFAAGSVNPAAGAFSPFVARFTRGRGDATFERMDVTLPEGLLADLGSVDVCPGATVAQAVSRSGRDAQSTAACRDGSRIGSVDAGAGAGAGALFYPRLPGTDTSGRVFLTEAYRPAGAPEGPSYGLAIEVPAVAGPYDLGNVLVRAGVYVDPETARLRVVSDRLPTILEGVPLQIRDVRLNVDRESFMVNPTSCERKAVGADVHSTDGRTVSKSSPYQVGNCSGKAFAPRLALRLMGKGQRRPGSHPGLRAVLTQSLGGANVAKVRVAMPKSVALDPENSNGLCSYEQGLAADCPGSSRIGMATAQSPLLKRPLTGSVYLVQGIRFDPKTGSRIRTTPTLLTKLRGEVPIDLRAATTAKNGKLVATFPTVPDAPVSKFSMTLRGGKGGILAVTGERNLCAQRNIAAVQTDGHNGKQADYRTAVKTPCAKKKRKQAKRR